MAWLFRRLHEEHHDEHAAADAGSGSAAEDSPETLRGALGKLVAFINSSAGRLPVEAVVQARDITDTIGAMIDTSRDRELDVYALISIKGITNDYLPTTLRSYLVLEQDTGGVPSATGRTPDQALAEQLDALASAATKVLTAAQQQDANALYTHGNFLRTKFSGSDLDL
jgi:hypothetical protein